MTWIKECIITCDAQHVKCKALQEQMPPGTPSRLLYLPDNDGDLKIVSVANRAVPLYAALSYCWGDGIQEGICTTANLAALSAGLDMCQLPMTVRDAVRVVRASGLNWLWVDRLCIVQDDAQDIKVELRNMAGIYANASVVLSAACARTSLHGFLNTREAPQTFVLPFDTAGDDTESMLLHRPFDFVDDAIGNVDLRAWTLQENAIAPRLLRFGEAQTEWRCAEAHHFDGGPPSRNSSIYKFRLSDTLLFPPGDDDITADMQETCSIDGWIQLVRDFTNRSIMKQNDRLPAIAAVAAQIGRQAGWDSSSYYAGLWKYEMFRQLLWKAKHTEYDSTHSCFRPELTRSKLPMDTRDAAPSWSWISCRLPVHFIRIPEIQPTAIMELISCSVKLKDPLQPYGEIVDSVLTIRAPLIPATTASAERTPAGRMSILDQKDIDVVCTWDSGEQPEEPGMPGEPTKVTLVVIGVTPGAYKGLMLGEGERQELIRLGYFHAMIMRPDFVLPEPQIVTIR